MAPDHSLLNSWAGVHTALLVEGQSRLRDLLGTDSPSWVFDVPTGLLTLGGHRLAAALLGSVAENDNSWLWSWANPGLSQQGIGVKRALPLKRFGEESGLWEFAEPSFSVDGVIDLGLTPGATIALVACPQIMGGALFTAAYGGGRLYAVVTDPLLTMEPPSAFTATRAIMGAISYGTGEHRDMVFVYTNAHQLPTTEHDNLIDIEFDDHSRLEIEFDADDRISRTRIEAQGS